MNSALMGLSAIQHFCYTCKLSVESKDHRMTILLRAPKLADLNDFVSAMQASQDLHIPWVQSPCTQESFLSYLKQYEAPDHKSYLVCINKQIAGVINLSQIIRGAFQSAFMGYYATKSFAHQGIMTQALRQTVHIAFTELQLHRLEANIQPENTASKHLVARCGFRQEGFSPKYLKIMGQWQDHERWAITLEDLEH